MIRLRVRKQLDGSHQAGRGYGHAMRKSVAVLAYKGVCNLNRNGVLPCLQKRSDWERIGRGNADARILPVDAQLCRMSHLTKIQGLYMVAT